MTMRVGMILSSTQRREQDREGSSTLRTVGAGDATFVLFNDASRNTQPEAGSRRLRAGEGGKEAVGDLRRYARTRILDTETHFGFRSRFQGDLQPSPLRHGIEGV